MAHFVDWLAGRMPFKGAQGVNGGALIWVGPGGVIEHRRERRLTLVGSHESTFQVRSVGEDLEFSGNPTKFLLGHNLWGFSGRYALSMLLGFAFADALWLEPDPCDFCRWVRGEIRLTRIDLTRMYRPPFAQAGWVPKWLSIAASVAHGGRQRVTNRGAYDTMTLYVGQHSRRISLKIYDKAAELRRHPPTWPEEDSKVEGEEWVATLLDYAQDTLRVEVTLRSMELKARGLDTLAAWSPEIAAAILDERIAKLAVLEDLRMTDDELSNLPRSLRGPYTMWLEGHDLRQIYKKAMFYRHRAALLKYGVDIAHVRPRPVVIERAHELGRPLKDYITGPGLEPPEDAPERRLLAM